MLAFGTPTRRHIASSTALAALLACLVLLPLLGHKSLAEWDEGIYAEVSREMLGGSWLVPHWNFQPWFEKPPLMLWITAVFFKLFGVSEFWARAGSAFSGVAVVALLHGWAARRIDLLTAWLSSVILLATFGFLHVCHVGEMDVLLTLGACIALIGLCEVDEGRSSGWYWFWIGFAIALMTKGAASIVIPITAILFALAQRWKRFGLAFAIGMMLFALLVLPWHLAMVLRFGHEFASEYLGLHVLARATHQIEGHETHWWFYFKVLLVSAPPFCLLYPVAVYQGYRRPELRVWAIFAAVAVAFFTLIQTRLPHYIAPAYPALALLTAVWVGDWIKAWLTQRRQSWLRVVSASAATWVITILLTHSALKNLHSAQLGDGITLLDNKEADTLLRDALRQPISVAGPLLLWREGRVQSIATVIFYARRPVQQIQLEPPTPGSSRDRYMFDPELLDDAVGLEPQLILLDKSLIAQMPPQFTFTPIRSSEHLELGRIAPTTR